MAKIEKGPVTTRRRIVQRQAAAIGALVVAGGSGLVNPRLSRAHALVSPEAAVEELLAGNQRFTAGRMTAFQEDLKILKQLTAERQEPFAAVLSCADSRVPVEIIFDQSIGHIFVTRVAGNVVTPETIASLEYGAAVLGIKAVIVMGHANCGAVKAAMQGKEAPGQISALYRHFQPAIEQAGSNLDRAIQSNAKIQSELLRKGSTVIAGLLKEKKIKVVAAYYDLARGNVTLLD